MYLSAAALVSMLYQPSGLSMLYPMPLKSAGRILLSPPVWATITRWDFECYGVLPWQHLPLSVDSGSCRVKVLTFTSIPAWSCNKSSCVLLLPGTVHIAAGFAAAVLTVSAAAGSSAAVGSAAAATCI